MIAEKWLVLDLEIGLHLTVRHRLLLLWQLVLITMSHPLHSSREAGGEGIFLSKDTD